MSQYISIESVFNLLLITVVKNCILLLSKKRSNSFALRTIESKAHSLLPKLSQNRFMIQ